MRKLHFFALMLLTTVALVSNIEAKNRDKSWEFGASVIHVDTDRDTGVDNGIGPEIRFGYNFTAKVSAEAQISTVATERGHLDDDFTRATVSVLGNFLTDRETRFVPFIMAGLGFIQETREEFTDGSGITVPEQFDSSAILILGVGTRIFFNDNWAMRGELRYGHDDSFEESQDEYAIALGVTWVVGGQK